MEHAEKDAEHAEKDAGHAEKDVEHAEKDVEHVEKQAEHAGTGNCLASRARKPFNNNANSAGTSLLMAEN